MRGILEEMGTVTHLFQCNDIFGDCVTSWVQRLHHTPEGGGGISLGLGSLHILSAKGKEQSYSLKRDWHTLQTYSV